MSICPKCQKNYDGVFDKCECGFSLFVDDFKGKTLTKEALDTLNVNYFEFDLVINGYKFTPLPEITAQEVLYISCMFYMTSIVSSTEVHKFMFKLLNNPVLARHFTKIGS